MVVPQLELQRWHQGGEMRRAGEGWELTLPGDAGACAEWGLAAGHRRPAIFPSASSGSAQVCTQEYFQY